jgi:hypothetical protein
MQNGSKAGLRPEEALIARKGEKGLTGCMEEQVE